MDAKISKIGINSFLSHRFRYAHLEAPEFGYAAQTSVAGIPGIGLAPEVIAHLVTVVRTYGKADLAALNDKYLRMMAEYDNFRKRSGKEREGVYADAYGEALAAILPVMDNLERALAFSEGETLTQGVKMTLRQFEDALKRLGVESFGKRGDAFDPKIHNAIMQTEDEELGENQIAEVLQKGYSKGDKIIRHAMVKVAK